MTRPNGVDIFTRIQMNNAAKQRGQSEPFRVAEPLVIGRCAAGKRILRVWPDADGWALLVDTGRIRMADKLAETRIEVEGVPVTVDDLRENRVVDVSPRRHGGTQQVMPRDFTAWPSGVLHLPHEHGAGDIQSAELVSAIETALRTKRRHAHTFSTIP